MICPYLKPTVKTVKQASYDDKDRPSQEIWVEEAIPVTCLQENCGAWLEDHCCYYNNVNAN
jgi:hypothetical protein